jgi:hypothetical protein
MYTHSLTRCVSRRLCCSASGRRAWPTFISFRSSSISSPTTFGSRYAPTSSFACSAFHSPLKAPKLTPLISSNQSQAMLKLPHKEERFMFVMYPLICLGGTGPSHSLWSLASRFDD